MEDRSLQHKDIAEIVGKKGLTTEIIAGRRKMSKAVAKRLSTSLSVPVSCPYENLSVRAERLYEVVGFIR